MKNLKIIDEEGCLTYESTQAILENTEVLECACPQHLITVIKSIRDFQEYETGCIIRYPKDAKIHSWLLLQSKEMEKLATQTIVQLMKEENIIDENLVFCIPPQNSNK